MSKFIIPIATILLTVSMISFPSFASEPKDLQGAVCRSAIAAMFDRSPCTVKITGENEGSTYMRYTRESDGTVWNTRCYLQGSQVIWATSNGRWRTSPYDGIVEYKYKNNKITIQETFSDGSKTDPISYNLEGKESCLK